LNPPIGPLSAFGSAFLLNNSSQLLHSIWSSQNKITKWLNLNEGNQNYIYFCYKIIGLNLPQSQGENKKIKIQEIKFIVIKNNAVIFLYKLISVKID